MLASVPWPMVLLVDHTVRAGTGASPGVAGGSRAAAACRSAPPPRAGSRGAAAAPVPAGARRPAADVSAGSWRRRWGGPRGAVAERSSVFLWELARREPGAGTDAAPPVLRVVMPRHMATPATLRLGGEQLGIDAGG